MTRSWRATTINLTVPRVQDIYNLDEGRFGRVIAAVFRLTPSLLIGCPGRPPCRDRPSMGNGTLHDRTDDGHGKEDLMGSTVLGHDDLSDEELAALLDLLEAVDSVEFKLTVPENDRFSSAAALGIDPLDAQLRQIYFFDTPDLDLKYTGVIVRARRVQQKADDAVVKLRPVDPVRLPDELRVPGDVKVEIDAMPGRFTCSGSLKVELESNDIQAATAGKAELESLFSKEQRALYGAYAPKGIGLNDLAVLGPIQVHKYEVSSDDFARELDAELWLFPDNTRMLELSTKCAPREYLDVKAETEAFLAERGIDLGGERRTKTSKALYLFAARL